MRKKEQKAARLDAATAQNVLLADLSNVLRKVKSGRPLSKYERQTVERCAAQAGPVDLAPNMKAAAALLGTSLRVIRQAKAKGCPAFRANGNVAVEPLRQWLANNAGQIRTTGDRESLELDRLTLDVQRRQFDLDRDRRELVPLREVAASWSALTTAANSALWDLLVEQSPPLLAGLAAEAVRVEAKKIHTRFCQIVSAERFTQEAEANASQPQP